MNNWAVVIEYRKDGIYRIGITDGEGDKFIFRADDYWSAMDCAKELKVWLERMWRKRGNHRQVKVIEM